MMQPMTFDEIGDLAVTADAPGAILDGYVFRRLEGVEGDHWFEHDVREEEDVLVRWAHEDDGAIDVPPPYSTSLDVIKATLTPEMRLVHLGLDAEGPEHLYMASRPWRCDMEIVHQGVSHVCSETAATMELAFLALSMRMHAIRAGEARY